MIDFIGKLAESLDFFVGKPLWAAFIVFIAMPGVGVHFAKGEFYWGIFLLLLQVPWFLSKVVPAMDSHCAYLKYKEQFEEYRKNSG